MNIATTRYRLFNASRVWTKSNGMKVYTNKINRGISSLFYFLNNLLLLAISTQFRISAQSILYGHFHILKEKELFLFPKYFSNYSCNFVNTGMHVCNGLVFALLKKNTGIFIGQKKNPCFSCKIDILEWILNESCFWNIEIKSTRAMSVPIYDSKIWRWRLVRRFRCYPLTKRPRSIIYKHRDFRYMIEKHNKC